VKHGIKLTGMPAWGVTHNNELLWDVVAFMRKLPDLSPEQYQSIVKSAPKSHGEMMQDMEGPRQRPRPALIHPIEKSEQ